MTNYIDYYTYRPKKVKHVHFIQNVSLVSLERDINGFTDEHPEYKILGIKLMNSEGLYISTITYLCDFSGEDADYDDFEDEEE